MKKYERGRGRRMIAILAAILALLLAATAVAVVQGNMLRVSIARDMDEVLAGQVQDVHVANADGGFGFSVDEVLWEGDYLWFSYTISVPEDGNTYLCGIHEPKINGNDMNYGTKCLDEGRSPSVYALGGDFPATASDVMDAIYVDPDWRADGDNLLSLRISFFQTDRAIRETDWDGLMGMTKERTHRMGTVGMEVQELLPNSEVLYYFDGIEGETGLVPVIDLRYYPEINAIFEARLDRVQTPENSGTFDFKEEDSPFDWETMEVEMREACTLRAQDLEDSGIAQVVAEWEITLPLEAGVATAPAFNDVAQHTYEMDGYSIEITKFWVSHVGAHVRAVIRMEGGVAEEWTPEAPFGKCYSLANADGTTFGTFGFRVTTCEVRVLETGERVYVVGFDDPGGAFPMSGVREVYLAPYSTGEDGAFHYDMRRAIRLEPIYNPDFPVSAPKDDSAEADGLSS